MRMPSLPAVMGWLCVPLLAGLVSGCTAGIRIGVKAVPTEHVYVAWSDRRRGRAQNFGSEEEISAATCPKVTFNELLFAAP